MHAPAAELGTAAQRQPQCATACSPSQLQRLAVQADMQCGLESRPCTWVLVQAEHLLHLVKVGGVEAGSERGLPGSLLDTPPHGLEVQLLVCCLRSGCPSTHLGSPLAGPLGAGAGQAPPAQRKAAGLHRCGDPGSRCNLRVSQQSSDQRCSSSGGRPTARVLPDLLEGLQGFCPSAGSQLSSCVALRRWSTVQTSFCRQSSSFNSRTFLCLRTSHRAY